MKTICSLLLLLTINAALGSTLGSPGSIDPTFALTNIVGYRTTVALQQDGKVLVGGPNSPYLIRVHPNGTIDSSFFPAFRGSVQQVLLTSNNAIIVRGSLYRPDSQPLPPIVRLLPNGAIDPDFQPRGLPAEEFYFTLLAPGNKLLVRGAHVEPNGNRTIKFFRMNSDGSLDALFNPPIITSNVVAATVGADGRVFISVARQVGERNYEYPVYALDSNGALDPIFNSGSGANYPVTVLAVQPDGKVLIDGSFSSFNGVPVLGMARLNHDRSLDPTFAFRPKYKYVYSIDFLPDGKLVIGGSFSTSNGVYGVGRLWPNGALDTNFFATIANVSQVIAQPDGRILCAGEFSQPLRLFGDSACITSLQTATRSLSFQITTGRTYCIWASQDLQIWQPVTTNTAQANPIVFHDPAIGINPRRFYRIQLLD